MEKRNIDLGVKINAEEEAEILKKAQSLGMNKSQFVRFILLKAQLKISSEIK